jgi:glyoxylase-like metal-dependent hydrolase (beta-lactamase superfamily II)/phosphoglycerate dehydrogenase-like enzyme
MSRARAARGAALACLLACLLACVPTAAADDLPKMKFNDVVQVAPGVFFRYSSISATDEKVVFGGSNNIWVVFKDFVVVVDANFPDGAREVVAEIKKTTDKPIRYAFDTHHHGDHAYGNAVFKDAGASIVAQSNCARLLRTNGPKEFADAGEGEKGRKDLRESRLVVPDLVFDNRLVLDDGTQRVEFLYMGHGHTVGDAVAYLPKHKIICTGDACVNGAFNFMGHSDSASWIRALEKMQQLDVQMVCPGHGPVAGKDLLETQKRYFVELRREVRKGIDDRKTLDDLVKGLKLPWYKEWTGVVPPKPNIEHVYNEMTGRIAPWDFGDLPAARGRAPKDQPGWTAPQRIVVPSGLMPARLEELKAVAPKIELVPVRTDDELQKAVEDADAILDYRLLDSFKSAKGLRWAQPAGGQLRAADAADLAGRGVVVTDPRLADGPGVADRAFALLLALTQAVEGKGPGSLTQLQGKTVAVIGLGPAGLSVARRANAFGLRVRGVDGAVRQRPGAVFSLDGYDKLAEVLADADVVIVTELPHVLTGPRRLGKEQLKALRPTAYLIDAVGNQVEHQALAEALKGKRLAGAGLTGPGLDTDMLTGMKQVVYVPPGATPEGREREWRLLRENVRRFAVGEALLGVVELPKP